jgi:light-regulated signal transduction histidine kinase (bacteriophytochrome)
MLPGNEYACNTFQLYLCRKSVQAQHSKLLSKMAAGEGDVGDLELKVRDVIRLIAAQSVALCGGDP